MSSRAPDPVIRPLIALVILLSGLKYAGMGTTGLGIAAAMVICGGLTIVVVRRVQGALCSDPRARALEGALEPELVAAN
jgi:hypothetical protein